jgi:hypothetical protein
MGSRRIGSFSLDRIEFAFSTSRAWRRTYRTSWTGPFQSSTLRHAHDLIGDAISFLFVRIVRLADGQLGLYRTGTVQPLYRKVASGLRDY